MPRPTKTFLVQAGRQRLRVDLRREAEGFVVSGVLHGAESAPGRAATGLEYGGNDSFLEEEAREPVDTAGLVALLAQKPHPAREITVLSDRLTAVVVDLPGLGGEDWESGAEMEAQTVSGLGSSESLFATSRLPSDAGGRRAWVVQAAMSDLAELRGAVARAARGGRLVGVGHPAGIRLNSSAGQLECWPDFALFHAPGAERIDLRGWNGPDAFSDALSDSRVVTAMAAAEPPSNLLLAVPGDPEVDEEAINRLDLAQHTAASNWAGALARAIDPLSGHVLGMPLVAVPKPPPSTKALVAWTVGCALLMLLLIGGHYLMKTNERAELEQDLAELQEPKKKYDADRRIISAMERELKALGEAKDSSDEPDQVDVFAHRQRAGALLDGIAAGAGVENAVVLEITADGLDPVVSGVATTFSAPQELAGRIDQALAAQGWRASLVRRTAQLLRDDGGPWTYEIRLTPGRPVRQTPGAGKEDSGTASARRSTVSAGSGDRSGTLSPGSASPSPIR